MVYPPAIIRKRDRLTYISALEKAQLGGSKEDYFKLIGKAIDRSLDIYLTALQGETGTNTDDGHPNAPKQNLSKMKPMAQFILLIAVMFGQVNIMEMNT